MQIECKKGSTKGFCREGKGEEKVALGGNAKQKAKHKKERSAARGGTTVLQI